MDEIAKYRAEVDAKLAKFGATINEIKTKRELRNAVQPTLDIDAATDKFKAATAKLDTLTTADNSAWESIKSEVDTLMDDIDSNL